MWLKFFVICPLEVPLPATIAALWLFAQILAVMSLGPMTLGPGCPSVACSDWLEQIRKAVWPEKDKQRAYAPKEVYSLTLAPVNNFHTSHLNIMQWWLQCLVCFEMKLLPCLKSEDSHALPLWVNSHILVSFSSTFTDSQTLSVQYLHIFLHVEFEIFVFQSFSLQLPRFLQSSLP